MVRLTQQDIANIAKLEVSRSVGTVIPSYDSEMLQARVWVADHPEIRQRVERDITPSELEATLLLLEKIVVGESSPQIEAVAVEMISKLPTEELPGTANEIYYVLNWLKINRSMRSYRDMIWRWRFYPWTSEVEEDYQLLKDKPKCKKAFQRYDDFDWDAKRAASGF